MFVFEKPIYVTEQGLQELEEELAYLSMIKRPQTIEQLQDLLPISLYFPCFDHLLPDQD